MEFSFQSEQFGRVTWEPFQEGIFETFFSEADPQWMELAEEAIGVLLEPVFASMQLLIHLLASQAQRGVRRQPSSLRVVRKLTAAYTKGFEAVGEATERELIEVQADMQ